MDPYQQQQYGPAYNTGSGRAGSGSTAPAYYNQGGPQPGILGTGPTTNSQPFQAYSYGNYNTPYGGGYDPNAGSSAAAGQSNPFTDPYARQSYYTSSPYAAFGQFTSGLPGGTANPYTRYLNQNYFNLQNQYQGDLANNPYESFSDYLSRMNPQLQSQFNQLSPMLRGASPQMTGRAQYVGF